MRLSGPKSNEMFAAPCFEELIFHEFRAIVAADDLREASPERNDFFQMLPHAVARTRWLDEYQVAACVHDDEGVLFAAAAECFLSHNGPVEEPLVAGLWRLSTDPQAVGHCARPSAMQGGARLLPQAAAETIMVLLCLLTTLPAVLMASYNWAMAARPAANCSKTSEGKASAPQAWYSVLR